MKIEFLEEGGFSQAGGIIEYETEKTGEETVYQRGGYLTVNIRCRDVHLSDRLDPANEDKVDVQRQISATGDLEEGLWGSWQLAMMGSSRTHQSINVSIRKSPTDQVAFYAGGSRASDRNDIDIISDESFYVEAVILPDQFEHLLSELSDGPCHLHLRVAFGKFPKFLAQWSPSISEGRTIKYLDRKEDLLNEHELPENFFQKTVGHEAVLITVTKPLPTIFQATRHDADFKVEKSDCEVRSGMDNSQSSRRPMPTTAEEISELKSAIIQSMSTIRLLLIATVAIILVIQAFS